MQALCILSSKTHIILLCYPLTLGLFDSAKMLVQKTCSSTLLKELPSLASHPRLHNKLFFFHSPTLLSSWEGEHKLGWPWRPPSTIVTRLKVLSFTTGCLPLFTSVNLSILVWMDLQVVGVADNNSREAAKAVLSFIFQELVNMKKLHPENKNLSPNLWFEIWRLQQFACSELFLSMLCMARITS